MHINFPLIWLGQCYFSTELMSQSSEDKRPWPEIRGQKRRDIAMAAQMLNSLTINVTITWSLAVMHGQETPSGLVLLPFNLSAAVM